MARRSPNILFISVDALRRDRLSLHGYERPTTPVLEELSRHALICDKNYVLNASTMGAFPTILTSSRPLSHGGFDHGASARPPLASEHFKANGYETYLLSTIHWVNRFHGYDKGVDHEQFLFSLNSLVGAAAALMRTSLMRFAQGDINEAEALAVIEPVILRFFDQVRKYAEIREQAQTADRLDFSHAPVYRDSYDFRRVMAVVERHRREFLTDKGAYVRRHLPTHPKSHEWIARDWRNCRKPGRLLEELYYQVTSAVLKPFDQRRAFIRGQRYKRYVDAHAMVDRITRILETRSDDKPFFLWTHLFDTHLPYCAGSNPGWYEKTGGFLEALGHEPDIDPGLTFGAAPKTAQGWQHWSALYDAAVRYIDEEIGRLTSQLKRLGLFDNTLLVVCGDHGEELGEHGDISHHFRLYEHNVRVPLMFIHPDLPETRIKGLTTIMDAVPTMADIAGLPPQPEWEGRPVTALEIDGREHVLMETFFGSPCDFANRPLYFAVRKGSHKLIWKEYRDPADKLSPEGQQLYDVHKDPLEQNNLYGPDHPALPELLEVIARRMVEIPEITDSRVIKAFGPIGEDAIKAAGHGTAPVEPRPAPSEP